MRLIEGNDFKFTAAYILMTFFFSFAYLISMLEDN